MVPRLGPTGAGAGAASAGFSAEARTVNLTERAAMEVDIAREAMAAARVDRRCSRGLRENGVC